MEETPPGKESERFSGFSEREKRWNVIVREDAEDNRIDRAEGQATPDESRSIRDGRPAHWKSIFAPCLPGGVSLGKFVCFSPEVAVLGVPAVGFSAQPPTASTKDIGRVNAKGASKRRNEVVFTTISHGEEPGCTANQRDERSDESTQTMDGRKILVPTVALPCRALRDTDVAPRSFNASTQG